MSTAVVYDHEMKLSHVPFTSMQNGSKDIEVRFWDEKRQQVKPGQVIKFTHLETGESFFRCVLSLHVYRTFEELYRAFPSQRFGYSSTEELVENRYDTSIGYTAEREDSFGVVGIALTEISF